jgi:hypothetical protein
VAAVPVEAVAAAVGTVEPAAAIPVAAAVVGAAAPGPEACLMCCIEPDSVLPVPIGTVFGPAVGISAGPCMLGDVMMGSMQNALAFPQKCSNSSRVPTSFLKNFPITSSLRATWTEPFYLAGPAHVICQGILFGNGRRCMQPKLMVLFPKNPRIRILVP